MRIEQKIESFIDGQLLNVSYSIFTQTLHHLGQKFLLDYYCVTRLLNKVTCYLLKCQLEDFFDASFTVSRNAKIILLFSLIFEYIS